MSHPTVFCCFGPKAHSSATLSALTKNRTFGCDISANRFFALIAPKQDVLLPLVLDERLPGDTWTIVAEQDHRFYQRDDLQLDKWLEISGAAGRYASDEVLDDAQVAEDNLAKGLTTDGRPFRRRRKNSPDKSMASGAEGEWSASAPTLSAAQEAGGESSQDTGDPHPWVSALEEHSAGFVRQCGVWQAGAPLDQNERPTRELEELVSIAKQADESNCGDFVWYSWAAHDNKATSCPSYGSFLVGLTKTGARQLMAHFNQEAPYHADCMILDALKKQLVPNASYVFPTVGNFCTNPSHIIKGTRSPQWENEWCAEGVAPRKGEDPKHLYKFAKKGGPHHVCRLAWDAGQSMWKTSAPPRTLMEIPDCIWETVQRRGWVDERDVWLGPGKGKGKEVQWAKNDSGGARSTGQVANADPFGGKAKGKMQGKRKGRAATEYNMLRDDPEVWSDMAGHPLPCAWFALELACDEEEFDYSGTYSRRVWDTRCHAQRLYQQRHFETDVYQAIIRKKLV